MVLLMEFMENLMSNSDPRTNDLLLAKSPLKVISIIVIYLLFVTKIGPSLMKNREPFKINTLLIVYNAFQIVMCAYCILKFFPILLRTNFACENFNYEHNEKQFALIKVGHIYFFIKLLDLLDTVFFVLRKKNNQITVLHVYHHVMMIFMPWYTLNYFASGHTIFIPLFNSIVHVAMYFYYLLTAYDSEYKKSIWWKKHITQLQLLQFILVFILYTLPFFTPGCTLPSGFLYSVLSQDLLMIYLFGNFYYKTYIRKKSK